MSTEQLETPLRTAVMDAASVSYGMEGLDMAVWIRWALVALACGAVVFWHRRQNRSFRSYILKHNLRNAVSDRLSQLSYNRSIEVMALCFLLLGGMVYHDIRINGLEQAVHATGTRLAEAEQNLHVHENRRRAQVNPMEEAQRIAGMTEAQQLELDILKPRYENLFINHHVLRRCNRSSPEDYQIINSALAYELNRLNAPAKTRQNILLAAKGSYQELYANLSCTSPDIIPMQAQMQAYLQSIVRNMQNE